MASLQISKIEKIGDTYKLHLDTGGNLYGTINISKDEINEDKIYDPLYQRSIIRDFMYRREV